MGRSNALVARFCGAISAVAILLAGHGVAAPAEDQSGVYVLTEHGGRGDGNLDNAPIVNELIARMPPSGGTQAGTVGPGSVRVSMIEVVAPTRPIWNMGDGVATNSTPAVLFM